MGKCNRLNGHPVVTTTQAHDGNRARSWRPANPPGRPYDALRSSERSCTYDFHRTLSRLQRTGRLTALSSTSPCHVGVGFPPSGSRFALHHLLSIYCTCHSHLKTPLVPHGDFAPRSAPRLIRSLQSLKSTAHNHELKLSPPRVCSVSLSHAGCCSACCVLARHCCRIAFPLLDIA